MKRPEHRVLIAGIGNIFMGDDAFGVEVIRYLLATHTIPPELRVEDFGIRGYDLAYAISDGHEAVVLIDACPRGDEAGTLYLLELNPGMPGDGGSDQTAFDGHSLDPVAALRLVAKLGQSPSCGTLHLIGCEPSVLDREDGGMDLSPIVAAAVPAAVEMLRHHLADVHAIHLKSKHPQPDPVGTAN